jgi:predicted transcriptional regulator
MKLVDPHRDISCNNVLECTFNLNEADVEVYRKLKELGRSKVEYLSQKLNKDRSTVYRSLQKLVSCEICIKETKTIEKGGYYHIYLCADIKPIKKKMKVCIDEWYRHMENTLTHFEKKAR